MPNSNHPSSITHNYRHVPGAPPPYRKPRGLLKTVVLIVGIMLGSFCLLTAIIAAFSDDKESTKVPTQQSTEAELVPSITTTSEMTLTPAITIPEKDEMVCIPANTERSDAKVIRIVDGDTIVVSINEKEYKVRYIGVDSPEEGSDFFEQATNFNANLLSGGSVILIKDVSETDRYDRLLRYVISDGRFVNYEMVLSGLAEAGSWPPDTACDSTLAETEKLTKSNQLGIWGVAAIALAPTQSITSFTPTVSISGTCPTGCTEKLPGCEIKGNISGDGEKIYHMPGQANYNDTVITPEKGERWFCSETEATANGWRKAER